MFTYEFESTKLMLSFLNTKGNGLNYVKIEDFKLNPTKANLFLKDPCIHWSELQGLATQFYLPSLFESNSLVKHDQESDEMNCSQNNLIHT